VYSKLYYESCVESVVCKHLKTSDSDVASLSIIRKVTKEVWEGEDAETQAKVAVKVAKAQEAAIEPDKGGTPQQNQE
jgi:ribosomal protein L31E